MVHLGFAPKATVKVQYLPRSQHRLKSLVDVAPHQFGLPFTKSEWKSFKSVEQCLFRRE